MKVDEANDRGSRGTRADFQVLKDAGIELEGKIAMANYGGIYRGTKVKNAQDNGMAGCIIFTDPMDDGKVTEENGYDAYPSKLHQQHCIPRM
jgi:N-acetylated-alpha-linked acidic dipeptidase